MEGQAEGRVPPKPWDAGTLGQDTIPPWMWDSHNTGIGPCPFMVDIVLVTGWAPSTGTPPPLPTDAGITIVIADVRFGRWDTCRWSICHKQQKYASIIPHLRALGWRVVGFTHGASMPDPALCPPATPALYDRVAKSAGAAAGIDPTPTGPPPTGYDFIGVLSFGTTGELYWSSTAVLHALGLSPLAATRTLRAVHLIGLSYVKRIFAVRRWLDSGSPGAGPTPSNPPTRKRPRSTAGTPGQPPRQARRVAGGVG